MCRSVRPAPDPAWAKPPSGSCQGSPVGRRSPRVISSLTRPSSPARAATWAETRGSIHGSPVTTYSGWAVSRARRVNPASAVISRRRSSEGQGRSGFTWSGVSGETPPQSSTPASSSARHSPESGAVSTRLGGAWSRTLGPSTIRATATAARYSSRPRSSTCRIAVSGLARKFWTMTSCTWPYWRATRRSSKIDSARSVRSSPIPTSRPVVNGIESRPASSSTRTPDVGVLVRGAEVRLAPGLEQAPRGRLEHHPHRRRHGLEPVHLLPRHHAGVEVGQQAGLLQHPHRHRPYVGQGGVVALLVEPLPRLGPPVLGAVAEGEQRLGAAELGALAGDLDDLVGGEVRRPALALEVPGRGDERAVVAPVAAQPGDRDEHLGGVGDHAWSARSGQTGVAHAGGHRAEPLEVLTAGAEEDRGLAYVEGGAALGPGQGTAHLLREWQSSRAGYPPRPDGGQLTHSLSRRTRPAGSSATGAIWRLVTPDSRNAAIRSLT